MLGWLTQLGFLQILMIFSDLKEKNIFTENIWVRVKPRQALFIIQNFLTVGGGGEMSTKIININK